MNTMLAGYNNRGSNKARLCKTVAFIFFSWSLLYANPQIESVDSTNSGSMKYPGIGKEQASRAAEIVHFVHAFEWENAEKKLRSLRRLERRENLPPLSYLLASTALILRVQEGNYVSELERSRLIHEAEKKAEKGLELCDENRKTAGDDSVIYDFIRGGILGFRATLEIDTNPFTALVDGLKGLRLLERVIRCNPSIYDAYLGIGIFNCTLAKSPEILKKALVLFNRNASLDSGLHYLRISAHSGQFTATVSKLYLLQFLSPYYGHMVNEKYSLMRYLQHSFPSNAYYVFLEAEESLCFHPDTFYNPAFHKRLKAGINRFSRHNFSTRRYDNLVRWQMRILNPSMPDSLQPSIRNLREFSYYPLFIQALHLRRMILPSSFRQKKLEEKLQDLSMDLERAAYKYLESSSMNEARRGFYEWHIRDALKLASKQSMEAENR